MIRSADPQSQRSLDNRPVAPHPLLRSYYEKPEQRQQFLNDLFDRTASQYRNIDKATGFGSGLWYRKKALQLAGLKPGMRVLDVACGPGLMGQCALELIGPAGFVIGLDPSIGMLHEAQQVGCRCLIQAVGEQLPFRDDTFDFLSMGYALRHVSDLRAAFAEYWRVLKPGGIVLLLEISRPRSMVLYRLLRWYIRDVLGTAFAAGTGNRELKRLMAYWWDTTEHCVPPSTIVETLKESGFDDCRVTEWFSGLLCDYRAVK
ncbi:MAG: class I SAM-dependent methyltransferase [Nitrospira sp.]|nr:class I SAM-dependent methyltransferase [Nitrospira sp.]MCP9441220.1 class I SAM-dependent methyltransferase [Nitrospira sp.]